MFSSNEEDILWTAGNLRSGERSFSKQKGTRLSEERGLNRTNWGESYEMGKEWNSSIPYI